MTAPHELAVVITHRGRQYRMLAFRASVPADAREVEVTLDGHRQQGFSRAAAKGSASERHPPETYFRMPGSWYRIPDWDASECASPGISTTVS
jgi:hypothetical protein